MDGPILAQRSSLARVVSSHDAFDRAEQALEAVLAEGGHLDVRLADDARGPGSVVQQGELAEVVALGVGGHGPVDAVLVGLGLAALEDVEGLAGIALADDGREGREPLRVEGVGDLEAFVRGQAGEEGNLLEEVLVHASALEGRVHEDAAEGDTVERPEARAGLGRDDGGGARGVVHEGELAEGATGAGGADPGAHAVRARPARARRVDVDVEAATLDDVEVVADVALGDDLDVLGRDRLLDEGTQHLRHLLLVDVGEDEVAGDGGLEPRELLGRLRVKRRRPVVARRRGRIHRLGRHGRATAESIVGREALARANRLPKRRQR